MRLGIVIFLTGIIVFQQLAYLPDSIWGLFLVFTIPLLVYVPVLRLPLIFISGFLWALIYASGILSTGPSPQIENQDITVAGIISAIPEQREESVRFQFDVQDMYRQGSNMPDPGQKLGRILLNWYTDAPRLEAGDKWHLKVRLKRPHGFMNPGGFDYEGWLFQRRIRATGYVREDPANRLLAAESTSMPLQRLRQYLSEAIKGQLSGSQYAGILSALAIGEVQGITPRQWEILTRTGTNHLISISGLHISMVSGMVFFLIRWCWSRSSRLVQRWPAPKAAALAGLVAAICYAALAGFSIPTQRSLIMIAVVMVSILMQRHRSLTNTLLVALLFVLLLDPLAVMSAGFWLSFVSVAVILFGMSRRLGINSVWWKWGRVHILIAVGLLPLMIVMFQRVPVLSPLANFVAVPWVGFLVVPLVLLGTALLMAVPAPGSFMLELASMALAGVWPVLEGISDLELAQWTHHVPVTWTLVPAIVGTLLLIMPRGVPARWLGLIWLLPVFVFTPARPAQGEVWFTLLDVGQGLASVVQTRNHVLVYDTGPKFNEQFDAGKAVITPYFRFQGLTRIDTLVIGHGDSDHIGGADSIADEFMIEHVISSVPQVITWTKATPCNTGQQWQWDGVDFRMLHPPPQGRYDDNNGSCVLRITNQGGSILLTGDIEKRAERQLIEQQRELLPSRILVAPHHGSKTSSTPEFINAVRPEYVLFPVGYKNRFGFPKEDVINRYQSMDAKLYNSAEHGAISFRLDAGGNILPPATFRQDNRRYWHIDV